MGLLLARHASRTAQDVHLIRQQIPLLAQPVLLATSSILPIATVFHKAGAVRGYFMNSAPKLACNAPVGAIIAPQPPTALLAAQTTP